MLFIVWTVIISVRLELTSAQAEKGPPFSQETQYTTTPENFISPECTKSLRMHHQPSNNCCLTTICWKYNYIANKNDQSRADTDEKRQQEKYKTLCSENAVYLFKEHLSGCCMRHNHHKNVNNNHTNFTSLLVQKMPSSASCSEANFPLQIATTTNSYVFKSKRLFLKF